MEESGVVEAQINLDARCAKLAYEQVLREIEDAAQDNGEALLTELLSFLRQIEPLHERIRGLRETVAPDEDIDLSRELVKRSIEPLLRTLNVPGRRHLLRAAEGYCSEAARSKYDDIRTNVTCVRSFLIGLRKDVEEQSLSGISIPAEVFLDFGRSLCCLRSISGSVNSGIVAAGVEGYLPADEIHARFRISAARLSKAVKDDLVIGIKAPAGLRNHKGNPIRKVYNVKDVLKHLGEQFPVPANLKSRRDAVRRVSPAKLN